MCNSPHSSVQLLHSVLFKIIQNKTTILDLVNYMHNTVVQNGIFFVLNFLPVYSAQVSIACFIAQCSLRFLRSPLCPIHAFVNSDQIIHAQFLRNHIHTQICTFPCVNMHPGSTTLMICILRIKHCQRHKGPMG